MLLNSLSSQPIASCLAHPAYWLISSTANSTGKRVIVLEGRVRGAGQSGKDTGELLAWNNHQFNTLQHAYGNKVTSQVAQSHQAAVSAISDLVKEESIPCQYTPVSGYIQASDRLLGAESKAFEAAGVSSERVRRLLRLMPSCSGCLPATTV